MEVAEINRYRDAIACLNRTIEEGRKDSNVDVELMLTNISHCAEIVEQLQKYEEDATNLNALTSLAVSLSANRAVLNRKIEKLNSNHKTNTDTETCAASQDKPALEADDTKGKEKRLRQLCIEETILKGSSLSLRDVVGLAEAKQALQEAVIMPLVFPHLFLGGRQPWKRILLYGPPGTGKTRLAQAVASEIKCTFYSVSSSDLLSSWVGESEKLIKELFHHSMNQTGRSVIFIDEIDSICRQRCSREDEHSRRIKTELLKQMEGADTSHTSGKLFLMCATNCPWDLDTAFLRRFQKRIYIPQPDRDARIQLMKLHSGDTALNISLQDWEELANYTAGYSGSDLAALTLGALFEPIRDLQQASYWVQLADGCLRPCRSDQQGAIPAKLVDLPAEKVSPRDVQLSDFLKSITIHRKTVSSEELKKFEEFSLHFGESFLFMSP